MSGTLAVVDPLDEEEDGLPAEEQPATATTPMARAPASARTLVRVVKEVMAASLRQAVDEQSTARCPEGEVGAKNWQ